MTNCTVEERAAATDVAEKLRDEPQIAAVDVLAPTEGPQDIWTVEIVVGRSYLPPQVCLAIGAHGLRVLPPVQTQGHPGHTRVVATPE